MAGDTSKRGLASADEKTREEVARKGGESVSPENRSFAKDKERASEEGKKGGETVSKNREHMAEIGRKGGEARAEERKSEPKEEEGEGFKKTG
jgi:general stress protein YciG